MRKLRAINSYYKRHRDDDLAATILDVEISQGQEDYTLFLLTVEDCMHQPRSTVRAAPGLGGSAGSPPPDTEPAWARIAGGLDGLG